MPVPTPQRIGDPNAINLADYKGPVAPCPHCKPEETMLGRACQMCMSNNYVARCLNCDGTGRHVGRSVWDGGRSEHASTCAPCGGKGFFPARESDWVRQQATASTAAALDLPFKSVPPAVKPMPNLDINRPRK